MVENIDINFMPCTVYNSTNKSLTDYERKEANALNEALAQLKLDSKTVHLMDLFFIRFHNQLRHFIFFQSFCMVRKDVLRLCTGPQHKGTVAFCRLASECRSSELGLSVGWLDFVLVCLLQLHQTMILNQQHIIKCWRNCDRHFTTGHFTKVLLLMMTILSDLRMLVSSVCRTIEVAYANLYMARNKHENKTTWLPEHVVLPAIVQTEEKRCTFPMPHFSVNLTKMMKQRTHLSNNEEKRLKPAGTTTEHPKSKKKRSSAGNVFMEQQRKPQKHNTLQLSALLAANKSPNIETDLLAALLK